MKAAQLNDLLRMLRAAAPERFTNYLKLLISFSFSRMIRKPIRKGLPAFVTIEPTNNCNLKCPECHTGAGKLTRPAGHLKLENYQKIIDEISKHAMYLTLYFQGEPYLHPDFFEMIKAAKRKKIYVATSTNAQFLNAEMSEKTVLSGLDRIIISFDGPDEMAYQTYRMNGKWDNVRDGVTNLVAAKKKLNSSTPVVILQCLLMKTNENKQRKVKEIFEELGADKLEFKSMQLLDLSKHSALLPVNDKYSRYRIKENSHYEIKRKLKNRCPRSWSSCVITWDGMVLPCCYDKNAENCFGNLDKQSIKEIWSGNHTKSFLQFILNNRKGIGICRNCEE